jgi:hypothetical protein
MSTKNKWLIVVGTVAGLIILFALPFAWHALVPVQGYGMMGGYGMHRFGFSPMFGGTLAPGASAGVGFGIFFMFLIPLGLLILIGLGIAALIKYLRTPPAQ